MLSIHSGFYPYSVNRVTAAIVAYQSSSLYMISFYDLFLHVDTGMQSFILVVNGAPFLLQAEMKESEERQERDVAQLSVQSERLLRSLEDLVSAEFPL